MFSLAVCQLNQWQHIVSAAVIMVVALLMGAAVAMRGERLGPPASVVTTLLLSGIMPLALVMRFWPFNGPDPVCGYTADPNAWLIFATLLSPLWGLFGLAGSWFLRRR